MLLFALMALLPGALIYGVSVQFLAKSIESWFEVRVDKALEGGLNLGRNTLDNMLKDLTVKADAMALALSTRPPAEHVAALNALREQAGVQEATLFTPARQAASRTRATSARASCPSRRRPKRCAQLRSAANAMPRSKRSRARPVPARARAGERRVA